MLTCARMGHIAAAILLSLPAIGLSTPAHAQDKERDGDLAFDIASQPIEAALAAFARKTHINIAFRTQAVGTVRSKGIKGHYTPQVALSLLLQGTGLSAIFTGPRSAIIYSLDAPVPPESPQGGGSRPFIELDTAQVRAPRIIGKPATAFASLDYARRAQARIRVILAASLDYRAAPYSARIGVTADENGRITQILVTRSNATRQRDGEVRALLLGEELGGPPPEGTQLPMWFRISTEDLFGAAGKRQR